MTEKNEVDTTLKEDLVAKILGGEDVHDVFGEAKKGKGNQGDYVVTFTKKGAKTGTPDEKIDEKLVNSMITRLKKYTGNIRDMLDVVIKPKKPLGLGFVVIIRYRGRRTKNKATRVSKELYSKIEDLIPTDVDGEVKLRMFFDTGAWLRKPL